MCCQFLQDLFFPASRVRERERERERVHVRACACVRVCLSVCVCVCVCVCVHASRRRYLLDDLLGGALALAQDAPPAAAAARGALPRSRRAAVPAATALSRRLRARDEFSDQTAQSTRTWRRKCVEEDQRAYTQTHTHTHTRARARAHTHAPTHTHAQSVQTRTHTHAHLHAYTRIHVHTHARIPTAHSVTSDGLVDASMIHFHFHKCVRSEELRKRTGAQHHLCFTQDASRASQEHCINFEVQHP